VFAGTARGDVEGFCTGPYATRAADLKADFALLTTTTASSRNQRIATLHLAAYTSCTLTPLASNCLTHPFFGIQTLGVELAASDVRCNEPFAIDKQAAFFDNGMVVGGDEKWAHIKTRMQHRIKRLAKYMPPYKWIK